MFYTVFSTNDTPYMQWQSELLEYSWKRAGQEGALVRLVATDHPDRLPAHEHAQCIPTRCWDHDPETGEFYPIYNKPSSLLEWLYHYRPEGTVLFIDPDCVFRDPIKRRVAPGSPASQAWVRFPREQAGAESPFGLGRDYAFLNEHCVRTDLATEPVMIPTLIHTSDLRRICARWLELCRIIRRNYRNADGEPRWESDMFAYLVACAEYEIQHEPVSLGVCTNWEPEEAADAPIIHYCQPILSKDGQEIFHKQSYKPWTWVDMDAEPRHDYGRDLVAIVNEHADARKGVIRPPAPGSRPRWRAGVMEGRVIDELLLEMPDAGKSLWLNSSGKVIWELCDGARTISDISAELGRQFNAGGHDLTADVIATVGQLRSIGFLELR